jgi:hypothetical protein
MGQITVRFEDYRSGSLPGFCVFTGVPTADLMVLRTRIVERDPAAKEPGPVLGFLTRTTLFENPRAPRNLLVGKLPVAAGHLLARQRRERVLRLGGWVSVFSLVVAAVSAQSWSPLLAVASITGMIVVFIGRIELRRNVPTATLIGAGTRVHLANVHQDFVKAVETRTQD